MYVLFDDVNGKGKFLNRLNRLQRLEIQEFQEFWIITTLDKKIIVEDNTGRETKRFTVQIAK